jgi:hypothetical protein
MPSSLINHTLENLAQGVSQQFVEARFESQVSDMTNCIPSVSRGVLRRNPLVGVNDLDAGLTGSDYFIYSYDRGTDGEQYIFMIGDGTWLVMNANDGTTISSGTNSYLDLPIGAIPRDSFDIVTIQDTSFIVNKTKVTAMSATVDGTANSHKTKGVYWIKKTAQVVTVSRVDTASDYEGYIYELDGQTVQAQKNSTNSWLQGSQIATQLASQLGAGYTANGPYVYSTNRSAGASWAWSDSFGNEASYGFKGIVRSSSDLPDKMPAALVDVVVEVTGGTSESEDNYWLRYTGDTWVEDREPGMTNTIDASTMPHVITRDTLSSFSMSTWTWDKRIVGSATTNPEPSFIGNTIESMFFHKNRLGFIANDSVVLSELSEYGNFWATSIRSIPATDPIDLAIATTDVTILRSAVSTSETLILFSDDAQFTLNSSSGPLTPESAIIEVASRYNYTNKSEPKAIGNIVYFASESGGYTQFFGFRLAEGVDITKADNLTVHVPSYFPKNIRYIKGHSNLGYVFAFSSDTPTTLGVYNTLTVGNQAAQAAFHKWTFSEDIAGIEVIDNELYIIFDTTGGFKLSKMSLEIPGDITTVTYSDEIGDDTAINYESNITFSQWLIKDGNGQGTRRGRLTIRTVKYTASLNSKYRTNIQNINLIIEDDSGWILAAGVWDDTGTWQDDNVWRDSLPLIEREYYNDSKVTISGNTETTLISFKSDDTNPAAGFELATVNYEGTFTQRSRRF